MRLSNAEAKGDLVSGAVLLTIGAAGLFWIVDVQIQEVAGFGANPRLYPKILSALLMVLGGGIFASGIAKAGKTRTAEISWAGLARVVGVAGVGGLFAVLAPLIGFTAATILSTAGFAVICGVRRPLPLAAVSLGTALTIRVVAVELLGLTLPGVG